MNQDQLKYRRINLILAGVISLVFIYSGIFSYDKSNYPIPSFHDSVTGQTSLSTGLSRSFSAIVRLEFDIAHQFNPYGLRIFIFFLVQFVLRFLFYISSGKLVDKHRTLVMTDVLISGSIFLICFKPFVIETFTDELNLFTD